MRRFAMLSIAFLTLALGSAAALTAAGETVTLTRGHIWDVDDELSSITFTATQAGPKFKGGFNRFDLQVHLNPDDLSDAVQTFRDCETCPEMVVIPKDEAVLGVDARLPSPA